MEINWFLPTGGTDGRYLGTTLGGRVADFDYLQQVAHAVDTLGFTGALLPTGRWCDDAWLIAARLAAVTKRMKFIVAFRPGLIAPALAARQAATFDRLSQGRLVVNIVSGGSDADTAADGLLLKHSVAHRLLVSIGCRRCMGDGAINLKSGPICGRVLAWCVAAPAPRWSATRRQLPNECWNMWNWVSRALPSPATPIWRKRIARLNCSFPSYQRNFSSTGQPHQPTVIIRMAPMVGNLPPNS